MFDSDVIKTSKKHEKYWFNHKNSRPSSATSHQLIFEHSTQSNHKLKLKWPKKKQHTNYMTHSHCLVQIVWRLSQIFHAFFQHSTTNWNWEKGNVIIYMKNLNAFNKWASIYWLNIHNQINAFLSIMILTVSFTSIFWP